MSNIGKYVWGEYEVYFDSNPFNSIEECKKNIKDTYDPDIPWSAQPSADSVYIGQITREFDYTALARDMSSMAKDIATEFDANASFDVDLWKHIESLVKDDIDMRPFKVRTIEKVKLEDLR
jgi:hypothetical protein